MITPRFFSAAPLKHSAGDSAPLALSDEIARHLQVLRMAAGDTIALFDGQGGEWSGVIIDMGKRNALVQLRAFDEPERESPLNITLVQALATGDKMDLIVQKAVELGVTAIQPIASERATVKLTGAREQRRTAHWQGVVQSACEQCGRNRVPVVGSVMSLEAWLETPTEGLRLMLHPESKTTLTGAVAAQPGVPLSLLVGPEGGFSAREIALAVQHDVQRVRLGPRVFRTETAALAALAVLNAVHGDLK